jgi:ElaB/YqjD/DUF883 family membrane-anchored ribosome-binding protein
MSSPSSATDTLRETANKVGDTIADLQAQGQEVAEQAQDLFGSLKAAIDVSIRTRPYTTLIVAAAVGFIYAAVRRR